MSSPTSEEITKCYTIVAFAVIIMGVGIPVWWKTTQTYRVPLPYNRIDHLSNNQWKFEYRINVYLPVGKNAEAVTLQNHLNALSSDGLQDLVKIRYKVNVLNSAEKQRMDSLTTLEDLSQRWIKMRDELRPFQYDILILSSTSPYVLKLGSYITQHRLLFIKDNSDISALASEIDQVTENLFTSKISSLANFSASNQSTSQETKSLWTLRAAPVYDVTFSLIVPEPGVLRARWNIEQGIKDFLDPILNKFSWIFKFNVQSQILYYLPLGVKPSYDESKKTYYLLQEQLPHIINPLEEKLGSHITVNPSLHFIVYIPKKSESPLRIYDSAGTSFETNAFFSPRWGGIVIHNPDEIASDNWVDVDTHNAMSTVVSKLRTFLGLNQEFCLKTECEELSTSFVRDWEVDFVIRQHITEYLLTTANTLRSLSELLGDIENIVINDEVGGFVLEAVDAFESCLLSLEQRMPQTALKFARNAYIASEKAFFDPSMLALLYFPEDQKYAVYVPLFLPVSVPVILSLFHIFKIWKKTRKSKQH